MNYFKKLQVGCHLRVTHFTFSSKMTLFQGKKKSKINPIRLQWCKIGPIEFQAGNQSLKCWKEFQFIPNFGLQKRC